MEYLTPDDTNVAKTSVVAVRLNLQCPKAGCGGAMLSNGEAYMTNPPLWHHACEVCGEARIVRGERYPRIEFVDVA